ncbi:MAG: hypothetical protein MOB07_25235 [Acidobacteria bacterium]|nr:hypothetical protein [Acidobacteriota bacterium]
MSINQIYRRMNVLFASFIAILSFLCSAAPPLMAQQTAEPPPAHLRLQPNSGGTATSRASLPDKKALARGGNDKLALAWRRSEAAVLKRDWTLPEIYHGQNQKQESPRHASGVFEIFADGGLTILKPDLPDTLELTPTHPDDVDSRRPERSQRTPLSTNAVPSVGIGLRIRPLQVSGLRNLSIGYRAVFPFTVNDFRQGPFSTRKAYQFFIGGEEAYTYARLSNLGPISEFRLAYGVPLRESVELDIGVKYALNRLTVKQGYDRYNEDEVFRTAKGKHDSLTPTIGVNFAIGENNWVGLGLEIEIGNPSFEGIGGKGSIRGGSPYFRVSRRF